MRSFRRYRFVPITAVSIVVMLVMCLTLLAGSDRPRAVSGEEGFVPLFNGKNLDGWIYGKKPDKQKKMVDSKAGQGYRVDAEKSVLYCTVTDGGNLFTEKQFANFVFRFEFKLTPGANNGVAIRAPREGSIAYDGVELQILDDTHEKYAKLRPEQYHGSVYDTVAAERGHLKPVGEWNEQEVIADGRRIVVKLNGATIVDANLDDVKDEAKLKKHPGLARTSGHVGFLGHGTEVAFRNIRIKELP